MSKLNINYVGISDLTPRVNNPRTHSEKQLKQLMRSIEHFSFTNPVLIDGAGGIIAGHGRVEAAKRLGWKSVPAICLSDLSEEDIRAYVIADNKLAENAGWDSELLALEFQYLNDLEIDFDLSLTGFELPEIDVVLQDFVLIHDGNAEDPADQVPAVIPGPPVTRLGDIWCIGNHRLICGDSTKADSYSALLVNERAQMIFTDAPYNVPVSGHICGSGNIKHREFAMASGEMSKIEFTAFLTTVFEHLVECTRQKSPIWDSM